jgi:hypothetical protein
MNLPARIVGASLVTVLVLASWFGVQGFDDRIHFFVAIVGALVASCFLFKRFGGAGVHGLWLLLVIVVWLQTYRLYRHEQWSSEMYRRLWEECRRSRAPQREGWGDEK